MAKKKLLIIHRALAPYRIEFFNRLSQEFDTQIFFEFDNPLEQNFDRDHLRKRIQFDYQILRPGAIGVKNLRLDLFDIVEAFRPDIILSSEFNLTTPILLIAKALYCSKARLIVMCDDNETMAANEIRYGKGLKSLMLGRVDAVLLCDRRALKLYADRPWSTDRLAYFPILQDDDVVRDLLVEALQEGGEVRKRYAKEGQALILFVGRLADEKNLPALLKAFSAISHQAQLLIVGAGPLEFSLKRQAVELGIADSVHWAGKLEGSSLYAHYNASDLFVLPSTLERFGTVVNEALLAGMPVVSSRIAAASELIFHNNGYVFDPFEPTALETILKAYVQGYKERVYSTEELRPSLMPIRFEEAFNNLLNFMNQ